MSIRFLFLFLAVFGWVVMGAAPPPMQYNLLTTNRYTGTAPITRVTLPNVSALAAITSTNFGQTNFFVQGFTTLGDGGEGEFVYSPTLPTWYPQTNEFVLTNTAGGVFYRSGAQAGPIKASWFGMGRDMTDVTAKMNRALLLANTLNQRLDLGKGTYVIGGQLNAAYNGLHVTGDQLGGTYLYFTNYTTYSDTIIALLTTNGGFTNDLSSWTVNGADWTWSGGNALHSVGTTTDIAQNFTPPNSAIILRVNVVVTGRTAGSVDIKVAGSSIGTVSANGTTILTYLTVGVAPVALSATPTADFDGAFVDFDVWNSNFVSNTVGIDMTAAANQIWDGIVFAGWNPSAPTDYYQYAYEGMRLANVCTNITVQNCTFNGFRHAAFASSGGATTPGSRKNIVIRKTRFVNSCLDPTIINGAAVEMGMSDGSRLDGVDFIDCGSNNATSHALYLDGVDPNPPIGYLINNCTFFSPTYRKNTQIKLGITGNPRFVNCYFTNVLNLVNAGGSTWEGCTFDSSSLSFFSAAPKTVIKGNKFTTTLLGSSVAPQKFLGFEVTNAGQDCTIDNNTFAATTTTNTTGAGTAAIVFTGSANNIRVVNNRAYDVPLAYVSAAAGTNLLFANNFIDAPSWTSTGNGLIQYRDGSIRLIDNTYIGGGATAIALFDGQGVTPIEEHGQHFYNCYWLPSPNPSTGGGLASESPAVGAELGSDLIIRAPRGFTQGATNFNGKATIVKGGIANGSGTNSVEIWTANGGIEQSLTPSSITRGGSGNLTATVTMAGHPFANGDKITVTGADQPPYNVTQTAISYLSSSQFTYLMASDPGATATGTILISGNTSDVPSAAALVVGGDGDLNVKKTGAGLTLAAGPRISAAAGVPTGSAAVGSMRLRSDPASSAAAYIYIGSAWVPVYTLDSTSLQFGTGGAVVSGVSGDYKVTDGVGTRRFTAKNPVTLSDGVATKLLTVYLPTNNIVGGTIHTTIWTRDASFTLQYHGSTVNWGSININGVISTNISEITGAEVNVTPTGSLTDTYTIVGSATNSVDIFLNANTSLTPTTLQCYWDMDLRGTSTNQVQYP